MESFSRRGMPPSIVGWLIMVREKEGKILWIAPECYLKIGFEGDNGKAEEKMIPAVSLNDFIANTFNLDEYCVNIKQAHKKIDDIQVISKCEIKKTSQKSVDNYD